MKIYQLKIQLELNNIKPPIWRRVQVKEDITFEELHEVVQVTMGWSNYHLWNFMFGNVEIGIPFEGDFDFVDEDARELVINQLLNQEKDKVKYTYDFGDSWQHKITLEKILEEDKSATYPVCIAGKRCCPPEDCGGVWGYEDFLKAIKDKKHSENKEMLEWVGGDFDPEKFDIEDVNDYFQK